MKLSRPLLVLSGVALSVWLSATPAQAEGRMDKLKRGLAGMAFGGVEVPATLCEECRNEGWGLGVTAGFFKAVGNFAAREVLGVAEFLTAPFPWPDDQYKPIMEPAYPWDRFTSAKDPVPVAPQPTIPQTPKPAK
jgi:putative exosortase-associated protein (TIGR04073 family)